MRYGGIWEPGFGLGGLKRVIAIAKGRALSLLACLARLVKLNIR